MRRWGIYRFGAWAAWAAVYAFVLNAMLASSLLAATPAFDAAGQTMFCLGISGDVDGNSVSDGGAKRAALHCKSCLPGLGAALPPPDAPDIFSRVALTQPRQFAFEARLAAYSRFDLYNPRAPPAAI